MHRAGESSGPTQAGEAIASLRGLLKLSRLTRLQATLLETLGAVAATVSEALGFTTVVIDVYRPDGDEYETLIVHGSERARESLLGAVTRSGAWAPMLDGRFRRHGVYFIPEGTFRDGESMTWRYPHQNHDTPVDGERAWRSGDALFATLDGAGGRRYGIISVDAPASGARPDDQQLEALGALAAHAALAIESSTQLAELRSALARNRAVIASALDCVIAVDNADRVIEFNPAAERTFGYRGDDVVGHDIAELLVPPDDRRLYRSYARRIRENADSSLLNRRIETMAMQSDGTLFPIELTVTRVDGAEVGGEVFYAYARDIAERRRGEEQLAYLAYHDALTGLPNRILVEQQMDLALARARRAGGAAALMFVDLDDFKEVNDNLGHGAGDRLLAGVAARLRGVLRDTDLLARQGGDEFLVLLADLADDPAPAAEAVGGKLLDALRDPFVVAGTEIRTGASIGISLYPDDAADTEALLRHADIAMYQAKAAGGGRLVFHQRSETLVSRRSSVSSQLRTAIAGGEMELHYQPVWHLNGGRQISGLEALLRWRHPDRGLLPADEFINLADQSSAGDELMDWALSECCRQARAWREQDLVPIVGINVSPHQLVAPGFAHRLAEQLEDHGLSPANFAVELTESAWTVDSAEVLGVIDELRLVGVVVALDDFGAGYSSLSRLRELGFDVIKIDGRLLRGVPGDATAVNLLVAVFQLAAACATDIVAEGVESDSQVQFLIEHGITHAQGFHLGPPMRGADLTGVLTAGQVPGLPPRRGSRRDTETA